MTQNESRNESTLGLLLRAAHFAAFQHRQQRRKGAEANPYINHPLHVASILANEVAIHDVDVLVAALLHDTVEDTDASIADIQEHFGDAVAKLVAEVSDDKSLPKKERKAAQIAHAPHVSRGAKLIKIADKASNVRDMYANPPKWTHKRKVEYMDWAVKVVDGMRGAHPPLEALFDRILEKARDAVEREV